jgi:uncharacterized membrane protein
MSGSEHISDEAAAGCWIFAILAGVATGLVSAAYFPWFACLGLGIFGVLFTIVLLGLFLGLQTPD